MEIEAEKSDTEQEEDSEREVEDRRTSSVYYCNSKKNRKTRYNCTTCKKYFCMEHAIMVCPDCYGGPSEEN